MALQTRKYDDVTGSEIGRLATKLGDMRKATRLLQAGRLGDLPAIEMPYSTVAYYTRRHKTRLQLAAQEAEEAARPKPLEERIDKAAKALLTMLEQEIQALAKPKRHDPKAVGEVAASLKKVRELAKPDDNTGPSRDDKATSPSQDPLTARLTSPSKDTPKQPKHPQPTKHPNTKPTTNANIPNNTPNNTPKNAVPNLVPERERSSGLLNRPRSWPMQAGSGPHTGT